MPACFGFATQVILTGMKLRTVATFIVVLTVAASMKSAGQSARTDTAFQKFWTAKSPAEAAKATTDLIKSGVTFDDALLRLKRGREYTQQKSGVVMLSNKEN